VPVSRSAQPVRTASGVELLVGCKPNVPETEIGFVAVGEAAEYEVFGSRLTETTETPVNRRTSSRAFFESGPIEGFDIDVRAPSTSPTWTHLDVHLETRDCILKGIETRSE
jgi:hypothetical protein